MSTDTHRVEIFSAGCPACQRTIAHLTDHIDPRHEILIRDMQHDKGAAADAEELGIHTVPALVVDGALLSCCTNTGPTIAALEAAGVTR